MGSHIHELPVAPLSACDMAQEGTGEHQGGVAVGEGPHNTRAPADLAVEAFNDVVCTNPRLVLRREVGVGQSLFNVVLHLLCRLLLQYICSHPTTSPTMHLIAQTNRIVNMENLMKHHVFLESSDFS